MKKSGAFRSTLIHLRLPFSLFLAPVFLFALSEVENIDWVKAIVAFLVMHLLLFPASNAYNSYYDKDESSIGLVKSPPRVSPQLLWVALGMDSLAILVSLILNLGWFFTCYLVFYGLASKAYSHPKIRLKKYPIASLLVIALFQGFYTYLASYQIITNDTQLLSQEQILPALLCGVNLIATYPLTQIYQHEEDRRRGDHTYSLLVGIRGTFLHAAFFFTISFLGFGYFYISQGALATWLLFSALMLPTLIYFTNWWRICHHDIKNADYRNAMRMSALASGSLNFFFILVSFINHT